MPATVATGIRLGGTIRGGKAASRRPLVLPEVGEGDASGAGLSSDMGEVVAREVMLRADLVGRHLGDHLPDGEEVRALRELERERRLLLHEQDAEALPVQLAERGEDL